MRFPAMCHSKVFFAHLSGFPCRGLTGGAAMGKGKKRASSDSDAVVNKGAAAAVAVVEAGPVIAREAFTGPGVVPPAMNSIQGKPRSLQLVSRQVCVRTKHQMLLSNDATVAKVILLYPLHTVDAVTMRTKYD
jgi:hypothetical protein